MNMKIIIGLLLVSVVFLAVVPEASAFPERTNACNSPGCHAFPPTSINITAGPTSTLTVGAGQSFNVGVTWSGGDTAALTAVKWPNVLNNTLFAPNPVLVVGTSPTPDGTASFTLTAPATPASYVVRVYATTGGALFETDFKDIAVTVVNPAIVSITPSTQIVVQGDVFSVNVTVDPAGNPINGVQFDLTFNRQVVRVQTVAEGNFLVQGGATSTFTGGLIDNTAGTVTNVSGNITPGASVSTQGNFAVISLIAQGPGTSSLDLSNININSPTGAIIPTAANNGSVTVEAAQLFGVNLTVDNATKSTVVNTNATYVLTVNNTGNGVDTFNLAVVQNPQGAAIAALNTPSITLNAGANGTVLLNVTNATPGNFVVDVTATSVNDPLATATVTTNTTVGLPGGGGGGGGGGAAAPVITGFAPPSPVNEVAGAARTFNITANQTVNVTWLINGTQVQFNESVTDARYTNASAATGTWNVTAIAQNTNGTAMQIWNWIVASAPGTGGGGGGGGGGGFFVRVNITPSTRTVVPGQTFIVNVTVDPAGNALSGVLLNLSFDSALVVVNSVTESNFLKQGGANTTFNGGTINNLTGTVTNISGNITDPGANVSTPGTFAIINLTAIAAGTSPLNLTGVTVSNPNGTVIPTAVANGTVKVLVASISTFGFGAGNGNGTRGGLINVSVNVTNFDTVNQTYVIEVSGVAADGSSLVGTGTVMLLPGQTIDNIPVVITVPSVKPPGSYSLFASIWKLADFPTAPQIITTGPITAAVV